MDIESALKEFDQSIHRSHLAIRISINNRFLEDASDKHKARIEKDNHKLQKQLDNLEKPQPLTAF